MLSTCKAKNPDFCYYHITLAIKEKLDYAKSLLRQAKGRSAVLEARKDVEHLTRLYNATPEGIKKLKEQIHAAKMNGDTYPLYLEEKFRVAKLDFSKRKAEYYIEKFQNSKKITPENIQQLFKNTKYDLMNPISKKNYFEIYDSSKEYNPNNVIITIKKAKGGHLITCKNSLNEPNMLANIIGSTDGKFGDIIAIKKGLINLRREIEKNKSYMNHSKHILSDARKYHILTLSKNVMFNGVTQKHYIFYSTKNIPYLIYRIDNNNGDFVEGYGALGRENTEHIKDAWECREWLYNHKNTERKLPDNFLN